MESIEAAKRIYHFADPAQWQLALASGSYAPETFAADGFIHLATEPQLAGVIDRHLRGLGPLMRLQLDPLRFGDKLVWEWVESSADVYPHLLVPIPIDAVLEAIVIDPDEIVEVSAD